MQPQALENALDAAASGQPIELVGETISKFELESILAAVPTENELRIVPPCVFSRCVFSGPALFDGSRVTGPMIFSNCSFERTINFSNVVCEAPLSMVNCKFIGQATFADSELLNVSFSRSVFEKVAVFASSKFSLNTDFTNTAFNDGVQFRYGKFVGPTFFNQARIAGSADFFGAEFSDNAVFERARFEGDAHFASARFQSEAHFENSIFKSFGWFGDCLFEGRTVFDRAECSGEAVFTNSVLSGGVFRAYAAIFHDYVNFDGFRVSPRTSSSGQPEADVSFQRATFHGPVRGEIFCSAGTRDCRVSFDETYARDSFVLYASGIQVTMKQANFEKQTSITGPARDAAADRPARVSVTNLSQTSLKNVVFDSVDLSQSDLSQAYDISKVSLIGDTSFVQTPRRYSARRTLPEEAAWRRRQPDNWYLWVPLAPEGVSRVSPAELESSYRSLRTSLEDSSNAPGASDFYFGEMEMRLHASHTRAVEVPLILGYKLISGYGTKPLWTFGWLLAILVGAALIVDSANWLGAGEQSFGDAARFVANASFSLVRSSSDSFEDFSNESAAFWTTLTLKVAVPTLLAIWVFALRSRFKR